MNKRLLLFTAIAVIAAALGIFFFLTNAGSENAQVICSGKNFILYDITKDNQPEYLYEIYNKDGELVKSKTQWRTTPLIEYLNDSTLLSICIGAGSGLSFSQYYDIGRDMFSDVFESVRIEGYGSIVYMSLSHDKPILVIRDIFDKHILYKEFDLGFSSVANPNDAVLHTEFLNEYSISITYLFGSEYNERTEIIRFI